MFDVRFDRSSRIYLVFASWSFERLSGFGDGPLLLPSVWCLPCVYPISLSLTICISKRACTLASCSGLCSGLDTTLGYYTVVGRLTLSIGCVPGLKEVGFVR